MHILSKQEITTDHVRITREGNVSDVSVLLLTGEEGGLDHELPDAPSPWTMGFLAEGRGLDQKPPDPPLPPPPDHRPPDQMEWKGKGRGEGCQ